MDVTILTIIIIAIIITVIMVMAFLTIKAFRKAAKNVDNIILISNLFTTINQNLTIIITKLEDFDRSRHDDSIAYKEVQINTIRNITERLDNLEHNTSELLNKMDHDINTLYMHCSKKIERDTE